MNQIEKNILLEEALNCAKRNWPVIPVEGKRPTISDWPNQAATNEETIRRWFGDGKSTGFAILTGQNSGIAVLDIDPRNGGSNSIERLQKEHGLLPTTWTVGTGGGGIHYYYAINKPLKKRNNVLSGIDLLADGAMAIAPSSLHESGSYYTWKDGFGPNDIPIASIPEWLVASAEVVGAAQEISSQSLGPVVEGQRNEIMFKLGSLLRGKGFSAEQIMKSLIETNKTQCLPPLSENELQSIAVSCAKYPAGSLSPNKATSFYKVHNGWTQKRNDSYLGNFFARVVKENIRDDGQERRTSFVIDGMLGDGNPLPEVEVSAEQFGSLSWVTAKWGAGPIIFAGTTNKDHLRTAILEFSKDRKTNHVFIHLGWRMINGVYHYLHSGGAITPNGNVSQIKVDASDGGLSDFELCEIPPQEVVKDCITKVFEVLDLTHPQVAYSILGSIFRAPLGEAVSIDFSLYAAGYSGIFKTEICSLAQAFYGKRFHGKNLPANWASTANSLERKTFLAKDTLLVVDDFAPSGLASDVARLHREAERLYRAQGNKSGRGRMNADGTLRPTNYPRCLILSNGEDSPRGTSLRARMFILEMCAGDVDAKKLSKLQQYAISGDFVSVMSAYIKWLAGQLDSLKTLLPQRLLELRALASHSNMHKRTPDIVASIGVGLETFLRFCFEIGAIDETCKKNHWEQGWKALGIAGQAQASQLASEDPVMRFVEGIKTVIVLGRAHFANADGNELPKYPDKWGWRRKSDGADFQASGERIGWFSNSKKEIWLHPDAAYTVVQQLAANQTNTIPISKDTLWKRLAERKYILASHGEGKNLPKRKPFGESRLRVLVFHNPSVLQLDDDIELTKATSKGVMPNCFGQMYVEGNEVCFECEHKANCKTATLNGPASP